MGEAGALAWPRHRRGREGGRLAGTRARRAGGPNAGRPRGLQRGGSSGGTQSGAEWRPRPARDPSIMHAHVPFQDPICRRNPCLLGPVPGPRWPLFFAGWGTPRCSGARVNHGSCRSRDSRSCVSGVAHLDSGARAGQSPKGTTREMHAAHRGSHGPWAGPAGAAAAEIRGSFHAPSPGGHNAILCPSAQK